MVSSNLVTPIPIKFGVILQRIFSGKCKADGACDKTTGECLDDTGCGNGKLIEFCFRGKNFLHYLPQKRHFYGN